MAQSCHPYSWRPLGIEFQIAEREPIHLPDSSLSRVSSHVQSLKGELPWLPFFPSSPRLPPRHSASDLTDPSDARQVRRQRRRQRRREAAAMLLAQEVAGSWLRDFSLHCVWTLLRPDSRAAAFLAQG